MNDDLQRVLDQLKQADASTPPEAAVDRVRKRLVENTAATAAQTTQSPAWSGVAKTSLYLSTIAVIGGLAWFRAQPIAEKPLPTPTTEHSSPFRQAKHRLVEAEDRAPTGAKAKPRRRALKPTPKKPKPSRKALETLSAEAAQLRKALRAVEQKDFTTATQALEIYLQKFPQGLLMPEYTRLQKRIAREKRIR